jgi:hypothetical protein
LPVDHIRSQARRPSTGVGAAHLAHENRVSQHRATQTNLGLAAAAPHGIRSFLSAPEEAMQFEPGDAALGRLDVRPTVDGIEPGLAHLDMLERLGLIVLNPPVAQELVPLLGHDVRVVVAGGVATSCSS